MRKILFSALLINLLLFSVAPLSAQSKRSFVGKKLKGITFTDTEGHTIDPRHYDGSVLVMYAGIPW